MKKYENILIKKIKGMYFNHNGTYNKDFVDATIKVFRKLNYISLGIEHKSIHHVDFISGKNGNIIKINISYRPSGIKPEDIDGILLEKKKKKNGLSDYEQLLYSTWSYHYKKNMTTENKMIEEMCSYLQTLKRKWSNINVKSYDKLTEEEKEEMRNQCKDLIKSMTKYETS